jgi:hypothetical protein
MCSLDLEYDAGLCYTPCSTGLYGVGPVCWEDCPEINPVSGGAICCRDGTTCSDKIVELAGDIPIAIAKAIISGGDPAAIAQAVIDAINAILGFVMPLCDALLLPESPIVKG